MEADPYMIEVLMTLMTQSLQYWEIIKEGFT